MKKITDFIINIRYLLLSLFIILAIISLALVHKVNINYDMTKYLDKNSETRIGLDIMENTFDDSNSSNLQVIVKNSNNPEEVISYLSNLENVDNVDYTINGDYTSYNITSEVKDTSKEAKKLYQTVTNYFKKTDYDTYGTISNQNKDVLPLYVVVIAVCSAMVILIISSSSYVEPFLFLFSILIAVAINMGTNIFLPSISNITESIAAILQMALSMDYSIMLMNRYHEEKKEEKDKVKAMKKALYNSFKSISSSSITTIVGLLALVFMEFTIGRDLGIVLAKGVLLSLLVIFTSLPGLILLFDKWINKTKKKSPNIKLNFMAHLSSKYHYIITALFVVVLIVSFFLKGNLTYTYTEKGTDKIESLFLNNNEMAVIYPSSKENEFSNYCKTIEKNLKIDDVLCYANTLNLPLTSEELPQKLADLDNDIDVSDYLLKIIYYHYYNPDEDNEITLDNIINFTQNNVYNNANMNKNIDDEMKSDISRLSNFASSKEINKKRNGKEIASVLKLEETDISNLLIYYHSLNNNLTLTLKEFITFVSNSKELNGKVDNQKLTMLNTYLSNPSLNSIDMANFLNTDASLVQNIYLYYLTLNDIKDEIKLNDLVTFIKNNNLNLPTDLLNNLNTFTNKDLITTPIDALSISQLFNIDLNLINQIYYLANKELMSPYEFTSFIVNNHLSDNEDLLKVYFLMNSSINENTYTYKDLSSNLNIDENSIKNIYAMYLSSDLKLSLHEFITFIITHQNDELLNGKLNEDTVNNLSMINNLITSSINNISYNAKDLAKILNLNYNDVSLIYSLYDININQINLDVSFNEFINFLNKNVMNNKDYASKFTQDVKKHLEIVLEIINNSLNNKKYTKEELYNLLKPLANDLDKNLIDLLYIYYGSVYDYQEYHMTIEEFSNYLNNVILNDQRFDDYITEHQKEDIISSKKSIKDAKDKLISDKYSRIVLNVNLPYEGDETYKFIENINKDIKKIDNQSYLVGDSTMAYEMNHNFNKELNLITILTIIFIFVVVLFTFKSFIIPLVLVLIIQASVFLIMGILSFSHEPLYFISILIVQSILMGATIDYAILYTSYYLEERKHHNIKDAISISYNKSLHTILTSGSILTIVTLIVGLFSSQVTSKICTTLSEGAIASCFLIIFFLPAILATFDKIIVKKKC